MAPLFGNAAVRVSILLFCVVLPILLLSVDDIMASYVYDRNTLFQIKSAIKSMDKYGKHFGGFPPPLGQSAVCEKPKPPFPDKKSLEEAR